MIEIRPARPDDADAVARAHVDAWRVGYRGLFPDEFLDSAEFEATRFDRWRSGAWANLDGSRLFVPVLDGRVVGFGHAGPERVEPACDASGSELPAPVAAERGEVYGFYVHPSAWGSGVATPLMASCTESLVQVGFPTAVLWVLRDNPRARRFYERVGWSLSGATGEWQGVAEVQYSITLSTT